MRKLKLAELVLDFEMYPRADVDTQHVHYMQLARQGGAEFPPIVIDRKSKRVVDGFHRVTMYRREQVEEVEVIEKDYRNEQALFLDAIRYNSGHGRTLTTFDRTHCAIRAKSLGIEVEELASALHLTADAVGKLVSTRVGKLRAARTEDGVEIPLKRTIAHMADRSLTRAQETVNGKLGGNEQSFYVHQLVMLIESDLIDMENESLVEGLQKLHGLLDGLLAAK